MPDIDWTIHNNIFTKDPSTSGVGNTASTDTKPAGSNSSSFSSSGSGSVSNSDISDAYGEALGILKDQGSIPENIPDTADNTKDAVTYFLYRLEAWIEANDDMVEYAEYIENQGRSYISNYLQTQKNPPFNVSAAFNEFLPVIKEQITEKQSISQSVKDKTTGLKENVEYNFELLMAAYAEAQGDNGYINSAEYAVVINMAVDYLMGVLLNGDYDNAFFAGIIPPKANGSGGYSINTDYKTAVSNIQKLANAQTPEDAQKYLNEVDAALRRFLGARNLGGSSKIGTAIENRQQQIFYEKCAKETGAVKDELCEAYADGSPKPEKEEVDKYVEFVNAIEAAFIAQYEGDGTNIKEEFSDYAQSVIKEHENVSAILKGLDVLEEKFGAYYNQLLEACKEDGELDNYLDATDRQEVIDQATGYVLSDIVRGNESGNMLVALGFSKDDRYKEVTSLLKGIENSVTPMDDYNKIRELITEMLTEAGANKIFALVEAQEELSNVDIDKNPALTDGLIENTIGEDTKVSLVYTIQGEKVVWADKEGKDDLNKVFTELEKRVQAAMKEHMGAAYDAKQVSEWFNYSIMAALNETSNVRTEVSISSFVQTVLAQFDSTSTMVLKGGDFESFAARELNMAKGIAESITAEDAQKLQDEQKAKEAAQNAVETAQDAVNKLKETSEEIKKLKDELDTAIKENKSLSEIQQIAQKIKEKAQEANQLAIDARKAAIAAQSAAAAHQSSAEIQALAQEAEKQAADASKIKVAINTVATEAQKSVDALKRLEEEQEAEAKRQADCKKAVDNLAEQLVKDYRTKGHTAEEQQAYIDRMEKIKETFVVQYKGDVAGVDSAFREFIQNIDDAYKKVSDEMKTMSAYDNDYIKALSEYGTLYSKAKKGQTLTAAEKEKIVTLCYDIGLRLFLNNNMKGASNFIPNLETDDNFEQAQELFKNMASSITPEQDWAKIQELLKNIVTKAGADTILDRLISKLTIKLSDDPSITNGIRGYDNNSTVTYGNDNLINVSFTLADGKPQWIVNEDVYDITQAIEDLKTNIKTKLKEQLGTAYSDNSIDRALQAAVYAAAQECAGGTVAVSKFIDAILKHFDKFATERFTDNISYDNVPPNTNDNSILNGLDSKTYRGDDNKVTCKDPYWSGGVVHLKKDDGDFSTLMNEMLRRLKNKYKNEMGSNFNDAEFTSRFWTAVWNVVNMDGIKNKKSYKFTDLTRKVLEELDRIL